MAEENLGENRPIVTLEEARSAGLTRYYTGKACPKGHLSERRVKGNACLQCSKEITDAWIKSNPDKQRGYWDKHRNENKDKINARNRVRKEFPCRHCGKHIDFPEARPGVKRVSRPKYCSDYCRLYSKVNQAPGQGPDGDCWEFQGGKHKFGYGMINMSGTKASDIKTAHAVAWEVANGQIPDGLFVLHKCDNPACCRPDHLFLGTHQDNMIDMIQKGRSGDRFYESEVKEIIELMKSETDESLAQKYGCNPATIRRIRIGKTWSYLRR